MKNELEGFPQEVIDKMLERQEEQGNKRDVTVFEHTIHAIAIDRGFDWSKTPEGEPFWDEVIIGKNFTLFFEKYPKKNVYPKIMEVSDDPDFSEENTAIRVVFMEKCGKFIAWACATTLEEAENTTGVYAWSYARDIQEEEKIVSIPKHEIIKHLEDCLKQPISCIGNVDYQKGYRQSTADFIDMVKLCW